MGEPQDVMYDLVAHTTSQLPASRPRDLMGVGKPQDLLQCVRLGVNRFDCVRPTRNARNGFLFTSEDRAVVNYLNAVGIRTRMRTMERAAFYAAWKEKKLRGIFITGSGQAGNAATRVEVFIHSKGACAYGGYPDIDDLFQKQAVERDRSKREALLHRIQELTIERAMYAPIFDFRALMGVGPQVAEHAINSIPAHPFPAWEDIRLKGN